MRPDLVLDEDDKKKRFKKYKDGQMNIENCDNLPEIDVDNGSNKKRKLISCDESGRGVWV